MADYREKEADWKVSKTRYTTQRHSFDDLLLQSGPFLWLYYPSVGNLLSEPELLMILFTLNEWNHQ